MSEARERFRALLADAPHWIELLAAAPAQYVERRDTEHPAFHGCIDWHSACHGVWALIAYQGLTGETRYVDVVNRLLLPESVAKEAAHLSNRPEFEMPYGRAWFLRLALDDRRVTGSNRLALMAREAAQSLVAFYRAKAPDPFAREYANASWALINLFEFAQAENDVALIAFVRTEAARMASFLKRLPPEDEEMAWPDFMAVTANFFDLLVKAGAIDGDALLKKVGARLYGLRPVLAPRRAHHHALNFSRAWALFGLFEATGDDRLLALYVDHMQLSLGRPSWWRGDYRAVGHWVPQFAIFALQRAMRHREPK
jgi:hypothetical protein